MAIYDSEEFDKIRCSKCGSGIFYKQDFIELEQIKIRPNNITPSDTIEYYEKPVYSTYKCSSCDNIIAKYCYNSKNERWTFAE